MSTSFNLRALSASLVITATAFMIMPLDGALAQTQDEAPNIEVRFADLDIGHAAGAKVLLGRIEAAAASVCGGNPDPRLLDQRVFFERCRKMAMVRAIAQVNSPMLAAMAGQASEPVRVAGR